MQTNIAFICKNPIVNTLRSQLNWSQYRMLIQIPDHDKREYQLYLPTEEQLINEIDEVKSNFNHDKSENIKDTKRYAHENANNEHISAAIS